MNSKWRNIPFVLFLVLWTTALNAQQAYITNAGGQMTITNGAEIKLEGTFINEEHETTAGKIRLNGRLNVSGDFISNTNNLFMLSTGILSLTGDAPHTIGGNAESPLVIYNLELNGDRTTDLTRDLKIISSLNLLHGYLELNEFNVTLHSAANCNGNPGPESMVFTSGEGQFIKAFNTARDFVFPLGTDEVTPRYSPISLSWEEGEFHDNSMIMASVTPYKHDENASKLNYLNRYWTLNANDVDNPKMNLVFTYNEEDVEGDEERMYGIQYTPENGTFRPTYHDFVDAETHQFAMQTSQMGDFTVGDLQLGDFSDVIVYPNPNNGIFSIKVTTQDVGSLNMEFTNMNGQQIEKGTITRGIFDYDFTNLPKGIYFVKIYFAEKTVTRKIVIY